MVLIVGFVAVGLWALHAVATLVGVGLLLPVHKASTKNDAGDEVPVSLDVLIKD